MRDFPAEEVFLVFQRNLVFQNKLKFCFATTLRFAIFIFGCKNTIDNDRTVENVLVFTF